MLAAVAVWFQSLGAAWCTIIIILHLYVSTLQYRGITLQYRGMRV